MIEDIILGEEIINSVSTDIVNLGGKSLNELIFEIMSNHYNEGFFVDLLFCHPQNLKQIKEIFKGFEKGKNTYQTDFGLLKIISSKDMEINWITVAENPKNNLKQ